MFSGEKNTSPSIFLPANTMSYCILPTMSNRYSASSSSAPSSWRPPPEGAILSALSTIMVLSDSPVIPFALRSPICFDAISSASLCLLFFVFFFLIDEVWKRSRRLIYRPLHLVPQVQAYPCLVFLLLESVSDFLVRLIVMLPEVVHVLGLTSLSLCASLLCCWTRRIRGPCPSRSTPLLPPSLVGDVLPLGPAVVELELMVLPDVERPMFLRACLPCSSPPPCLQ